MQAHTDKIAWRSSKFIVIFKNRRLEGTTFYNHHFIFKNFAKYNLTQQLNAFELNAFLLTYRNYLTQKTFTL